MSYARNKRKKMRRRVREYPRMFKDGVAIGSFNWSKREDPDADKAAGRSEKFFTDEEFLASFG